MINVALTYNPYTREKTFSVNGESSQLKECWGSGNRELSEWCDKFFEVLYDKYNTSQIVVDFKGIFRDFEILQDAKDKFVKNNPNVSVQLKDAGCTNAKDRLEGLKKLFLKMQKETPFEALKSEELKELFNKIVSSEFEMAVVATMSSGKSTLINSMLGKELLPARNEATTATLAKIYNEDKADHFTGKSYNKDHVLLKECDPLTLSNMNELNDNPSTSVIEIIGNIEGIKSDGLELVLTDTPGPNNSRTDEHKEHTYSLLTAEYKPMILYVLNGTQLETNDDNSLLRDVAKAMNSGGRQAQERFIFILNKADEFDPAKGEDLQKKIEDVKVYLEKHNIHNPRVFPAASRMAKVIRQHLNNQPLTETEEDEILPKYEAFIKRAWRHYSDLAPLSDSSRKELNAMLSSAQGNNNRYKEALIYTGIPAIELAISEYLIKYALPAKITEGVYSFKEKIENLGVEAEENEKLKGNKAEVEKKANALKKIDAVLKKGEKFDEVCSRIEKLSVKNNLTDKFEKVSSHLMSQITQKIQKMNQNHISKEKAEKYIEELQKFLPDTEAKFKVDIRNALNDVIKVQAQEAISEYKKYLEDLIGSVSYDIPPAAFLGDLVSIPVESTLDAYSKKERVRVGEKEVRNTDKKWYKPWTWLQPSTYTVGVYEDRDFIDFSEYLENLLPSIEASIESTRDAAFDYAEKEEKNFKKFFKQVLLKYDEANQKKLSEQKKILSDKEEFEKMIVKNEENLLWLTGFKKELDSLLTI